MALKSVLKGLGRAAKGATGSGSRDAFGYERKSKKFATIHERNYRREVSRLAAIANKRIERLERNNLQDSPAYQKLIKNGVAKFGVRGKDFNQVQSEMSRLNNFLKSQTSTIRGINNVLKTVASNTGLKYSNMKELKTSAASFFELSSKVEQYLRSVEDVASAIGYQKIWEVINEYVATQSGGVVESANSVDSIKNIVDKLLLDVNEPDDIIKLNRSGDFTILLND